MLTFILKLNSIIFTKISFVKYDKPFNLQLTIGPIKLMVYIKAQKMTIKINFNI